MRSMYSYMVMTQLCAPLQWIVQLIKTGIIFKDPLAIELGMATFKKKKSDMAGVQFQKGFDFKRTKTLFFLDFVISINTWWRDIFEVVVL